MFAVRCERAVWFVVRIFQRHVSGFRLDRRFERWFLVQVQGSQSPTPGTAAAQSQQETKLQMDWRILMCATRGCLRARLNNLGKCVVTTAEHTPISVLCVLLCSAPYIHNSGLDVWIIWRGLSPWIDADWCNSALTGGISYFFGRAKTAIQDLLTTHIPISLVSYTEVLLGWSRANTT